MAVRGHEYVALHPACQTSFYVQIPTSHRTRWRPACSKLSSAAMPSSTRRDSQHKPWQAPPIYCNPDVIGLVGTGYSSAAESHARYCSLRQKPMISPGSTSNGSCQYPFFLRSIASDGQQMKRMASIVYDFACGFSRLFGWG
eukprot:1335231-Prymnesium_polylepis.1